MQIESAPRHFQSSSSARRRSRTPRLHTFFASIMSSNSAPAVGSNDGGGGGWGAWLMGAVYSTASSLSSALGGSAAPTVDARARIRQRAPRLQATDSKKPATTPLQPPTAVKPLATATNENYMVSGARERPIDERPIDERRLQALDDMNKQTSVPLNNAAAVSERRALIDHFLHCRRVLQAPAGSSAFMKPSETMIKAPVDQTKKAQINDPNYQVKPRRADRTRRRPFADARSLRRDGRFRQSGAQIIVVSRCPTDINE